MKRDINRYKLEVIKTERGTYQAKILGLDVIAEEDTREEAIKEVYEMGEFYLEDLPEDEIP